MNILSEGHWTSTCLVTMNKFRNLCNGSNEASSAVLSHLSGCGKAHKISINRGELIEVGYYPSFRCSYITYLMVLVS